MNVGQGTELIRDALKVMYCYSRELIRDALKVMYCYSTKYLTVKAHCRLCACITIILKFDKNNPS